MYRAIVEGNPVCYKRRMELERRLHEERLKAVKPVVRPSPPCQTPRTGRNLKYETQSHERFQEIDRDNKLLLDKLYKIMVRSPCTAALTEPRGPSSLNWKNRKDEEERIAYNNKFTYQKIAEAKPLYTLEDWQKHTAFHAQRFRNVCEHPAILDMKEIPIPGKPAYPHATSRPVSSPGKPMLIRNFSAYRIPITPRRRPPNKTRPESQPPARTGKKTPINCQSFQASRAYLHSNDREYSRSLVEAAKSRRHLSAPAKPPK
ncbi:conserved hypothetical protein [Neospora caninum Liverpool]|uniref:Uncharacterized protein n=1 Tax=Neospora caninum (strain Liverpool) TaxID=572307 RepID=F0VJX6_NEOCL|nr:conserved hypothetical protein [Neospora caninum Liverpool]CBZ54038.1 conserved hypothetical protein [Neospora caninum Liverpool]CEL68043.1 TPA: hypothetical protein BN1204_038190 [Neospora caninum Liverpool]|eukprot:XP_003884069.1 conserved hypothetical protein [Neospora caninum Liverpool]